MTLIELGAPATEPLLLADAKAWCRIERADEDALVAGLIRAAREAVERETRLVLARRAFRFALDGAEFDGCVRLPRGPRARVTAIAAFDARGAARTFAPDALEAMRGSGCFRASPDLRASCANGLEIDFEAGFEAAELPESLRLALRHTVAACFETRAAVPESMQPALFPAAARALVSPFREVRV